MGDFDHVHVPINRGNNSSRVPKPGDPDFQPESHKAALRQQTMIRQRHTADIEIKVDGSSIELGPEFTGVPTMDLSSARVVVEAILSRRETEKKRGRQGATDIMRQMQAHLDVFARFRGSEQMGMMEALMIPWTKFNDFEKAQLLTLVPGDHDEAKALIPSLTGKYGDEELDELLKEIVKVRDVAE
jgi:DNA-directed RNA polymerase II subunit RPB4